MTGWLESLGRYRRFPGRPPLRGCSRLRGGCAAASQAPVARILSGRPLVALRGKAPVVDQLRFLEPAGRCLCALPGQRWPISRNPASWRKAALPALSARLIAALGCVLKWEQFHYGPMRPELWRPLGQALLAAEEGGVADKAVSLVGRTGHDLAGAGVPEGHGLPGCLAGQSAALGNRDCRTPDRPFPQRVRVHQQCPDRQRVLV